MQGMPVDLKIASKNQNKLTKKTKKFSINETIDYYSTKFNIQNYY